MNYTFFSGNFIFNEDWAKSQENSSSFQTERENSYYGSRTHFIRTLYSGKLSGTGFKIKDQSGYSLKYSKVVSVNKNYQRYLNPVGEIYIEYHGRLSKIHLSENPVYFNETGYFATEGISWAGDMSNQRMADWLPYEYS